MVTSMCSAVENFSVALQNQGVLYSAGGSTEAVAGGAVAGRKAVDFENLAFAQGNHLMTNKKCDLPQKSYRAAHKVRYYTMLCFGANISLKKTLSICLAVNMLCSTLSTTLDYIHM